MENYLSFVTIDVWTLIFTWGNLLILYALMKKLLFKPVTAILEKRRQDVDEIYNSANDAQNEAEKLKTKYETKLSEARGEAQRIITDATKKAEAGKEEIISGARKEARLILNQAEENIKFEKDAAFDELKNEVSDMAIMLASKIVSRDIDESAHHKMIEEFIDCAGESL